MSASSSATADDPGIAYHRWYYETNVWQRVSFLGLPCLKSVTDLWNYQEILSQLRPALVIESGTNRGGSALYFAHLLSAINPAGHVLAVDIDTSQIAVEVLRHPQIAVLQSRTTDPAVGEVITHFRAQLPGPAFAILDSDHTRAHVLGELLLRQVLVPGDYLVVEDTCVNGHPIHPGWGEGPMEALLEYERRFPDDYLHDTECEHKFGFTFATNGFLIRK
jgi:cephalosporin hydroxylase